MSAQDDIRPEDFIEVVCKPMGGRARAFERLLEMLSNLDMAADASPANIPATHADSFVQHSIQGEIMSKTHAAYQKRILNVLEVARSDIKTFQTALEKNPVHAMEWSDTAFKAAARIGVLTQVASYLAMPNDPVGQYSTVTLQDVYDALHDRFMHATRYIDNRSTSTSTNRMNDCCISVLSEELKELARLLKDPT